MLVVATTVRVLYGVLCHTTNLGPAIALDGVLVVGPSGLEQGLVGTTTTGDNTNLRPDSRGDRLFTTRWEAETGGALVLVVRHDNGKGSRAAGKGSTITALGLNVADDGPLRNHVEGEDVSD